MIDYGPNEYTVRQWCKWQYKKRRRAITKSKLAATDADTEIRARRLEQGGYNKFVAEMKAIRERNERILGADL